MGYSYSRDGKLACDHCHSTLHVRKRPCPYSYCPAPAICDKCWTAGVADETKKYHADNHCREKHEEFQADEKRRVDIIASGAGLRHAARGLDDGWVKVWFRFPTGSLIYHMAPETYHAIPYGQPATLADYQAIGAVAGPYDE